VAASAWPCFMVTIPRCLITFWDGDLGDFGVCLVGVSAMRSVDTYRRLEASIPSELLLEERKAILVCIIIIFKYWLIIVHIFWHTIMQSPAHYTYCNNINIINIVHVNTAILTFWFSKIDQSHALHHKVIDRTCKCHIVGEHVMLYIYNKHYYAVLLMYPVHTLFLYATISAQVFISLKHQVTLDLRLITVQGFC